MLPFLTEHFGNPSGSHAIARSARRAVEDARDVVASHLGCAPGEVVFTAGGTESDNLAVLGVHAGKGGTVICSAVEHHAVLRACASVGGTTVPVDHTGRVDLDALTAILVAHDDTSLVSIMAVNNEVGTIQPLADITDIVRRHAPRAVLHTDAVAAVPWLDIALVAERFDLVSVSAHKFGGPKGVGALVVRNATKLAPVLHGGSQERDRRPGTHDVAGIVGMSAALTAAMATRQAELATVSALRNRLAAGVAAAVPGVTETVEAGDAKVASCCHLQVSGVDQEELLVLLDEAGIYASAGAACASGALEPSHVLIAMGLTPDQARSAVRFSLGYSSTAADVDAVIDAMPKIVERLRA